MLPLWVAGGWVQRTSLLFLAHFHESLFQSKKCFKHQLSSLWRERKGPGWAQVPGSLGRASWAVVACTLPVPWPCFGPAPAGGGFISATHPSRALKGCGSRVMRTQANAGLSQEPSLLNGAQKVQLWVSARSGVNCAPWCDLFSFCSLKLTSGTGFLHPDISLVLIPLCDLNRSQTVVRSAAPQWAGVTLRDQLVGFILSAA